MPGEEQRAMAGAAEPFHAHIYFDDAHRPAASRLRGELQAGMGAGELVDVVFVGKMTDGPAGPHPLPQYEVHFLGNALATVIARIQAHGLRALVHRLTDDDLADHTSQAHWIGEPLALDLSVLDPPGVNQGIARFGISDF
jgi:DOPA 4,5-dioxygenase